MMQLINLLRKRTIRVVASMAEQKNPPLSFSHEHTITTTTGRTSIYENNIKTCRGLPWWYNGWKSTCRCRRHGFHPQSRKIPHAVEQLRLCVTTTGAHALGPTGHKEPLCHSHWSLSAAASEARAPRACARQQKEPPQGDACIPRGTAAPVHCSQRKPGHNSEDPAQPKINKF